jgi:hypothetical protein
MNRHFLRIAFTSIAAVALSAPLTAQQPRRGMIPPSEQRKAVADDNGPRPQAFSVSLVLGEMQSSGGSDTVPAAARKALTDVKDFLPYKAYRLLDSQWTLCCGGSPILTRLRGPEEQDYSLELMPRNAGNGKYSVHFSLWEPRGSETAVVQGAGASGSGGSTASLDAQRAQLEQRLAELRRTLGENHPDVAEAKVKIEALQRALNDVRVRESISRTLSASAARRAIIDTSFTMDVGETVVVGTSRLKGDKALIALLTAVAPTKGTAK